MGSAAALVPTAPAAPLVAETPDGVREVQLRHAECCEALSAETGKLVKSQRACTDWSVQLGERAKELLRLQRRHECGLPGCAHCKAVAP